MQIGVIADDITGATDVALMLGKQGAEVLQLIRLPSGPLPPVDVVVIALKTRSCPADEAVRQSLAALAALRQAGARQILFKYCSTFDSTDQGNIGPVIDALMQEMGVEMTIATPAFPANGRTVYQGHLFVGAQLLSDSPMKDHPLTPMRDSNLVAVLGRQTARRVGLVAYRDVEAGPKVIANALASARADGTQIAIVDATSDRHLVDLGQAVADFPLITGGSGVALGLAPRRSKSGKSAAFSGANGPSLILAGSCSAQTRAQVEAAIAAGTAAYQIDPLAIDVEEASRWAAACLSSGPVLIYSSADPDGVARARSGPDGEGIALRLEKALAEIAIALVRTGVTRLIVAGGETSGAVLQSLGVDRLVIGPEIAPGVPWTRSLDHKDLVIAAKSGNFGAKDFFLTAWDALDG